MVSLVVTKGGEMSCEKEALANGLCNFFLTCSESLSIVVTPLHNHQTSSVCIEPPTL